jgi:hypothetical protein
MNLDVKIFKQLINKLIPFVKKYASFAFVLVGLAIFGFLVFKIRTFANIEPSETKIDEKISESRPIKIDQNAAEKVQELQDANVEIKSLFDSSRNNPFQE